MLRLDGVYVGDGPDLRIPPVPAPVVALWRVSPALRINRPEIAR